MSISDKLIEIEELLTSGYDVESVARMSNVPIDWVIEAEKELMGWTHYEHEREEIV